MELKNPSFISLVDTPCSCSCSSSSSCSCFIRIERTVNFQNFYRYSIPDRCPNVVFVSHLHLRKKCIDVLYVVKIKEDVHGRDIAKRVVRNSTTIQIVHITKTGKEWNIKPSRKVLQNFHGYVVDQGP